MALSMLVTSSSPFHSHKLCCLKSLSKQGPAFLFTTPASVSSVSKRGLCSLCFFNFGDNSQPKGIWIGMAYSPAMGSALALANTSFVLTGLVEITAVPYLGIQFDELSLDENAGILFVDQSLSTAVVLGVLFGIANTYQPLPEDFFKYDWREPYNFQKGWLFWDGVGLAGALIAIALTGAVMSFFSGETPARGTDTLVSSLPLIGSSNVCTACLVGITGVLAPILEETVFRGFFMASLTKWVPTPAAIIISVAVFALAHLSPGEFPQLFVLGTVLGISYAQTHTLLTPITIHAFWNSGVILLLTFLQLQGYDIKELLQTT